jgi:hypothetical protein
MQGFRLEKEYNLKNLICYCFNYSVEDIKQDHFKNGHSTIMEKIQREKKLGNCQCAEKNPKGK